jgi:hypothetical protein
MKKGGQEKIIRDKVTGTKRRKGKERKKENG